ncbi:NADH-ubiquinone oxidoreductase chain 1 [Phtheirospermum japonicum]|uniref:NADH-ubiquinone oxidoreductase chain 1 n=1 Tax=Phtheirospermum japonicum TaxID=374723 RepID=A0A830D7R5_9LAMI|nr:NADH-ubiquinone oxidoreductase chain 1 [Phtheirospermum japonicum]
MLSHRQRLEKHGRATCRETCTCGSGRGPRYTVLICVGPRNSSEIVMAQKQIWSSIPLFLFICIGHNFRSIYSVEKITISYLKIFKNSQISCLAFEFSNHKRIFKKYIIKLKKYIYKL